MNEQIVQVIPERSEQEIPIEREPVLLGSFPTYHGAYQFTPTEAAQTVETNGLLMENNVTIDPIPSQYYDMSKTYSYFGLDPLVVDTRHLKVMLSDTLYPTWTPSTTQFTILASSDIGTYVADMVNYEYVLDIIVNTHIFYQDGTEMKETLTRMFSEFAHIISRRAINFAQVEEEKDLYNYSTTLGTVHLSRYHMANGVEQAAWSGASGLFPAVVQPTLSSTSADNPTITIKTPTYNAKCSSSSFSETKAALVDVNKSYVTFDTNLIRVNKRSMYSQMNRNLVELWHTT